MSVSLVVARWLSARHARREWAARARVAALRQLARNCRAIEMTHAQTVEHLAETLYRDALEAGGGECDVGLYGPRLFRHEAEALVRAALERRG